MNKQEIITIKKAKLIQAKRQKRYGLQLTLSFELDKEIIFYHTFWVGNFKTFQEDDLVKNYILWDLFIKKFHVMGFTTEDAFNIGDKAFLKSLIGHQIIGTIGTDEQYKMLFLDKVIGEI